MVTGVGRIDGHQRHGAQIGAAARVDRLGRLGLVDHCFGKFGGNAVIVNGDQADGLG